MVAGDDRYLVGGLMRGLDVLRCFDREHPTLSLGDVARQLGIRPVSVEALLMSDRTLERRCAEIRALLGFREATVADGPMSSAFKDLV